MFKKYLPIFFIILLIGAIIVVYGELTKVSLFQFLFQKGQPNGEMSFLRTEGQNIVDENSNKISLRGVNLGSWLLIEVDFSKIAYGHQSIFSILKALDQIQDDNVRNKIIERGKKEVKDLEDLNTIARIVKEELNETEFERIKQYYLTHPPILDEKTVWDVLVKRFGIEKTKKLQDVYRSTWITENDFRILKEMGINVVRVPFFYMLLEDESAPYKYKEEGFEYLDTVVEWCGKYKIYCILDMHGAPGGQSLSHITGWANQGDKLWNEKEFQKRTVALWKVIAERYKDKPQVAGYDLLNEPWPPNPNTLIKLYDEIYKAIRSVDKKHIIFVENEFAYIGLHQMPKPSEMNWENIVYSPHFYGAYTDLGHKSPEETFVYFRREQERLGAPLYIGEFGGGPSLKAIKSYMELFNKNGWHWTLWTYKTVPWGEVPALFAIYTYKDKWERPDLYEDSYESILAKFKLLDTTNFMVYEEYRILIKENSK